MAENKKSIVMYVDWLTTFEQLDDAEAGRLVKHLFRYVNDENPVAPDKLTQIVFEPIKQQLKRDLQRWESIRQKRSIAGQHSALKRNSGKGQFSKPLHEMIPAYIDESQIQPVSTNVEQVSTHVENDPTNSTVNVNVNVINKDKGQLTAFDAEVSKSNKFDLDFDLLLQYINQKTGRKFKQISKSVQLKYKARLKDGYSKRDIMTAIDNACKLPYHVESGYQYLTPEFFSRSNNLDKYGVSIADAKHEQTPAFVPKTEKRSR